MELHDQAEALPKSQQLLFEVSLGQLSPETDLADVPRSVGFGGEASARALFLVPGIIIIDFDHGPPAAADPRGRSGKPKAGGKAEEKCE